MQSNTELMIRFASVVLGLLVQSCSGVTPNLAPGSGFTESERASVVVIGMRDDYRIQGIPGEPRGSFWQLDTSAIPEFNTAPQGGYIVVPVTPTRVGESYGIYRIVMGTFVVQNMCKGSPLITFEVPPRSVLYFGDLDVEYRPESDSAKAGTSLNYSYEFDAASAFMRQRYPEIAGRMRQGTVAIKESLYGASCGKASLVEILGL